MDHKYLAEHDGSELAAGRGSGLEEKLDLKNIKFGKNSIPYMHMTYAPLERRLDTAVWRALFASSARQARQFVIHGYVRVNGQKMPYPGYLLNPGDMFQVDVDRVMFATGEKKTGSQARMGRVIRKQRRRGNVTLEKQRAERRERRAARAAEEVKKAEKRDAAVEAKATGLVKLYRSKARAVPVKVQTHSLFGPDAQKQRKLEIQELMVDAQKVLNDTVVRVGAKRKQALRAWTRSAKLVLSQLGRRSADEVTHDVNQLVGQLETIKRGHFYGPPRRVELRLKEAKIKRKEEKIKLKKAGIKLEEAEAEAPKTKRHKKMPIIKRAKAFREALVEASENPIDATKPYATPWRPRPYMSAFAFIPRYLEVNPKICSAVYLRHPVARPGLTEVPTPFPAEMQQLAFNWYLRRR